MIRIEIIDPPTCNRRDLLLVAELLTKMAEQATDKPTEQPASLRPQVQLIHKDDSPSAGAPNPSEVFGKSAVERVDDAAEAAAAFGGKPAEPLPDPAVVFGGVAQVPNVPLVPAVPAAGLAPVTNLAPVLLDTAGLPWDARIHSGAKTQTVDGKWKPLRNVDKALVPVVEAELRAVAGIPVPNVPAVPAIPSVPAVVSAIPDIPLSTAQNATTSETPSETPAPAVITFPLLMQKVQAAKNSGRLTDAEILDAVKSVGLTSLPMVAAKLALVPDVNAYIDAVLMTKP